MHPVGPKVEKERAVFVLVDEPDGMLGEDGVNLRSVVGWALFARPVGPGAKMARLERPWSVDPRLIDIEPMLERRVWRRPDVPLAEVGGPVAVGPEEPGNGAVVGGQPGDAHHLQRSLVGRSLHAPRQLAPLFFEFLFGVNPGLDMSPEHFQRIVTARRDHPCTGRIQTG